MTKKEALTKAIKVLGGQAPLASVCGKDVRQQYVSRWVNKLGECPPRYMHKIEAATRAAGDPVLAKELCPDAFDFPDDSGSEAA